MFSRLMKAVGMPISPRRVKMYSEIRLGDPVVENALALDDLEFLAVEGRGVVLEMDDERAGFRSFVENLGLAFVEASAFLAHRKSP